MLPEAWLAVVIGVSGVGAIVLIALALYSLRPTTSSPSSDASAGPTARPAERTSGKPRQVGLLAAFGRPRRQGSVEDNFERALARIDAVDPYLAQRRIGQALAHVGLVSPTSVFDDPPPTERDRPSGEVTGPSHRWEDEA